MTEDMAKRDLNPWLSIWTRPRSTLHWVLGRDTGHWVLGLAAVSGVTEALDRASSKDLGDALSLPGLITVVVFVGAISGVISLYMIGFLLRWTGGWLGGRGSSEEIRAAVAVPNLISVWALVPWILLLAFVGEEMFTSETPRLAASSALRGLLYATTAVGLVLGLWYIIATLVCLSDVQRFSVWKAIANCILAFLVVFIPILAIVLVTMPWSMA